MAEPVTCGTEMRGVHIACLSPVKWRGVWEIDPMHFFHMGNLSAIESNCKQNVHPQSNYGKLLYITRRITQDPN